MFKRYFFAAFLLITQHIIQAQSLQTLDWVPGWYNWKAMMVDS